MGFFSEIIQDCAAGDTSAAGGFMRSNNSSNGAVDQGLHSHDLSSLSSQEKRSQKTNLQNSHFQNDNLNENPNAFPLADANIDSDTHIPKFSRDEFGSDVSHSLIREGQNLENGNLQSSKLSNQNIQTNTPEVEGEEFNFADEQSIEDELEIDLAAQLHSVQVERSLKTRSGVRDNVPCSEESQMISREGGDSDEHLHEINVNKSSIDRKLKSGAENDRDYMSDSEFFESSSVGRECDKILHNRYNSDKSFYDRKVELTKSQINQRESKTSIDEEDINLRDSQGQRTQPERYTKGSRLAKQNASDEGNKSIDMTSIFSELESAVSALSADSHSNKPNQSKNRYKSPSQKAKSEAETQIEDLFELNGKNQLGSRSTNNSRNVNNRAQKQSNKSQANPLQPKVSIGQIDVIVNAAPEAKSESTGSGSSANPFSSASSSQSSSNSSFSSSTGSSKYYTRRI